VTNDSTGPCCRYCGLASRSHHASTQECVAALRCEEARLRECLLRGARRKGPARRDPTADRPTGDQNTAPSA
jgi:hypothetical protein